MKSILIYYFSGTGNTKEISRLLVEELESEGCTVKLYTMEDQLKSQKEINLEVYDLIGLAYPIYGFGTPGIVSRIVEGFPEGGGKNLFIYKTGADFISINHNASTELIEVLEKRGYNVFYDRIIAMASNWLVAYDDRLVKQLYNSAIGKVKHMSREILNLKRRRYKTGHFLKKLSMGISHLEKTYGSSYFVKSLRTNQKCNHCEICVKRCPNQNILFVNENPVFGDNCLWCMRCVYTCPQKAIFSKGMNFSILKNGYDLKRIVENEDIGSDYITEETGGYFKHFYNYLSDESL
ncbi:MAG: EFR1 family ferrodoxin [Spirochaetaceae bacterium]|nr:EFR1 family ferrodoxin [Spirochaetaceae bacterium]